MPALPLPILTFLFCLVACVLVWRLDLGNRLARTLFTAVFGLIATATLLIGLRFGYGFEKLIVIQRVIPLFIGPTIYLGFLSLTRSPAEIRPKAILHLAVALVLALLPQLFPPLRDGFDLAIAASYLFYAVSLILLWRRGPDSLTHASLGLANGLRLWMLFAAGTLLVMLVFESAIAVYFAMSRSEEAVWLISLGSIFSMACMIVAIVVFSQKTSTTVPAPAPQNANQESIDLEARARTLLIDQELYLDTNLTLERLAKRLHVPARALSEAINQTQKMNVSQYVNGFRLEHAAKLLTSSKMSVVRVMENSGFLTRSNFYREFERVYSVSPNAYRKNAKET